MPSTILALDLGTKTGYAWGAANGTVLSGVWDFKPTKYDGAGVRYLKFVKALDTFHQYNPIGEVYFEAVRRHLGADASTVYNGFMTHLQTWCERNKVRYLGVPVGTIKKFWTGKGNASKEEMIASAEAHGYSPVDDNEADAIALLYYAAYNGDGGKLVAAACRREIEGCAHTDLAWHLSQ